MADRTGLEPATSTVTGQRSNQLSYRSRLSYQVPSLKLKVALSATLDNLKLSTFN